MTKCPICEKSKPLKNKFCSFTCRNKWINSRKDYVSQGIAIAKVKAIQFPKNYFNVVCYKCGNGFSVRERIEKFPSKKKYFCSRSCANGKAHTSVTKQKISSSLKRWYRGLSVEEKIDRVSGVRKGRIFRSKGEIVLLKMLRQSIPQGKFTYGGAISHRGYIISRDIVSKKLMVAIEYDGIWHFKNIKDQLAQKQFKDRLYEEWIRESDYRLIRVTAVDFTKDKDLYDQLINGILNKNDKILKLYHFDRADFKL